MQRRNAIGLIFFFLLVSGCGPSSKPDLVWGKSGVMPGDLKRPRAAVIDHEDRLWIVDFTARIQAYDLDGNYLDITFTTPDFRNGRPSGLGVANDGKFIVCDSHYHCLRFYDHAGAEHATFGGTKGNGPGEFGYISDVVQDDEGFYYISEFGPNERITKLDAKGQFVTHWGEAGSDPGQFNRTRALALHNGQLYVADACNHRIQVFTRRGALVRTFGTDGDKPGELKYPYDLAFNAAGELYVAERGNHRIQKFTTEGKSLGVWGSRGRQPGQFADPWALVVDRHGRVHVIDTENHRVQRLRF
jgi:streptogramin lyase